VLNQCDLLFANLSLQTKHLIVYEKTFTREFAPGEIILPMNSRSPWNETAKALYANYKPIVNKSSDDG
jgi:hypothetical protein